MKILQGARIPKANGHYSTAVVSNHLLYISGQLPIPFDGKILQHDDFETEFNIIFQNILSILQSASISVNKIVKVTAYISDLKYFPQFNSLFADFIGKHKPARTVIPVVSLPHGFKLEVELIVEV
ncbi:RidA family protein [Sphingobacterium sp. HJSM2_6]|uniref:RidA family protein n=1 Tax=Sphingobacterium sp. HJSM2_6 TaxID=3366264 RepID=UPI003BD2B1B0